MSSPSFVLELGLEVDAHSEAELNKRFEAARQLYNSCLAEAKRRLDLLRQSKESQRARTLPKTQNGKPNSERTRAYRELNSNFGFTEYSLHAYATEIRHSWIADHIDSNTAQKLATRGFKAVQRVALGQAKRVRFKGKNQLKSVEGKSNRSGIRYKGETGSLQWSFLELKCIIDSNDKVVVHGLSCPLKYCRIIKRILNGTPRFFVQLVLEGKAYQKFEAKDETVGLDIGPSTIASVAVDPKEPALLERFCDCDELKTKQKEIRRLQRKLDRSRRATNPQNYNPDETIKKGEKRWHYSKRYLKTQAELAELQRKVAAHRKSLHGNLANRILKQQGKHLKTEKLSYRAFQRQYGKSVRDRAPRMFVEILRRKAENAGGSVEEFPTKTTKLSQYCHNCGKYNPKPLSQRWHTCCQLNIQRDLYSAFLAGSVVDTKLDTDHVLERWRSTEAVLQRVVSELLLLQVANVRHLPDSFGLSRLSRLKDGFNHSCDFQVEQVRDRATRPQSSDASAAERVRRQGIPEINDRDVVAVQLELPFRDLGCSVRVR